MSALANPGVVVQVEAAGLPTMSFDLAEQLGGETGLLTRLFRPRVTVLVAGRPLIVSEPAGPPEQGLPLGWLAAGVVAAVGLYLLAR